MAELTDWSLLFHAIAYLILAGVIFHAVLSKHSMWFWRTWPPPLLAVWGTTALVDGLIYGRRWTDNTFDVPLVYYDSGFTFTLNVVGVICITTLVILIFRGRKTA